MSVSAQLYYHRNFQKTYYPEISVQSPGSNRAERPAYCDFLNAIDCVFIANTILGSLAKGSWLAAKLCYQMPVYLCNNFTLKIKSSLSAARLRDRLHHPQCKEPSYGIANPRSAVRQRELSVACYQYKNVITKRISYTKFIHKHNGRYKIYTCRFRFSPPYCVLF